MRYIENIVIGTPIVDPKDMFPVQMMIGMSQKKKRLITPMNAFFHEFL